MRQPAVSKHLRVLRGNGLVKVRPLGQKRVYSLDPESLREISDWIDPYRVYWRDTLDRLDAHLSSTRKIDRNANVRSKK